jgi:Na+-driven multidrug efflux pump
VNKYKKYKKIYAIALLVLMILSISSVFVFAEPVKYIPLEKSVFGGSGIAGDASTETLSDFVGYAFKLGLGIAVVLTIVMIMFGGIQYMTTESFNGKGDAKKRINDALIGLGLALVSYLLLYTINPCLVNFSSCNNKLLENKTPTGSSLNYINKNV